MWKKRYQDLLFPVDVDHVGLRGFYMRKITGTGIPIPDEHMLKNGNDLKLANLPTHLYEYRQFDTAGYSLDNLTNDTLWLSAPEDFNDPFDSRNHSYALDFIETQMDFIHRFEEYLNTKSASFRDERSIDSPVPINSLLQTIESSNAFKEMAYYLKSVKDSENKDDFLDKEYVKAFEHLRNHFTLDQWESHKTIVRMMHERADALNAIHHDANRALMKVCSLSEANDSTLMWSHYTDSHRGFCVEYDIKRLLSDSALLKNLYPVLYHDVAKDEPEDRLKGIKYFHLYSVLRKSSEWKYEKEWRFVYTHNDLEGNVLKLPVISAVYLGCDVEEDHKKQMLGIAKKKNMKIFMAQKKGQGLTFNKLCVE